MRRTSSALRSPRSGCDSRTSPTRSPPTAAATSTGADRRGRPPLVARRRAPGARPRRAARIAPDRHRRAGGRRGALRRMARPRRRARRAASWCGPTSERALVTPGTARAGARQPPEQRARGRARGVDDRRSTCVPMAIRCGSRSPMRARDGRDAAGARLRPLLARRRARRRRVRPGTGDRAAARRRRRRHGDARRRPRGWPRGDGDASRSRHAAGADRCWASAPVSASVGAVPTRGRRHVERRVPVEEPERHEVEAGVLDRHDRPVLRPGDVRDRRSCATRRCRCR